MDALKRNCRIAKLEHIPNGIVEKKIEVEEDITDRIETLRTKTMAMNLH